MDWTTLLSFIVQQALILIPVLFVIGFIIKNTEISSDKFIPVILLCFGILGAVGIMGLTVEAVLQGVLVTGATILFDQIPKQLKKDE